MKTATLPEIRKELAHLPEEDLKALVLRLAKHSKDNKELLTYLLFEADFEENYISGIMESIALEFNQMNTRSIHQAKKTLQKVQRNLRKYIRYSGKKETEIELRLFFCGQLASSGIRLRRYPVILNMYTRQLEAIEKSVSALDEDLQYDYREAVESARSAV